MMFPKEQTCCDQVLTNIGHLKEAVPTVKNCVRAFEDYDYIVGPSGPCIDAVRC